MIKQEVVSAGTRAKRQAADLLTTLGQIKRHGGKGTEGIDTQMVSVARVIESLNERFVSEPRYREASYRGG